MIYTLAYLAVRADLTFWFLLFIPRETFQSCCLCLSCDLWSQANDVLPPLNHNFRTVQQATLYATSLRHTIAWKPALAHNNTLQCKRHKRKRTLVQALRLCTGRTDQTGSRGIALPFHDHGTRRGWRVSVTPRPFFTPGKEPVPIVQETGWAPGPVWTSVENLTPHRD